ncbi:MAG TPA: lipocalin-like domain-containing protein [Blastocatellia bacterium]|nr:lipocalin-like domain-containing protein [Blastocatellia bacterium]
MTTMNNFIGAWKLISVEDYEAGGGVTYPYGRNPAGLLIYDASGYMSVQIMRRDREPLSSDKWEETRAEEIKSTVEGFTAFFGTYEVDEQKKTIIHRVEGHLLPGSAGKELKRSYEFSDNLLILRPSATRRVVWERLAPCSR